MSADTGGNSVRSRIGNGLTYFTSFVLMASSAVKFARVPKVAEQMAAVGFSGGKLSSLVVGSRDGLPLEPGGFMPRRWPPIRRLRFRGAG